MEKQPDSEAPPPPYEMSIDLNALNHLGINLYSNIPAVLSEVVANSYDADAESVEISIDKTTKTITIVDDGYGMDKDDINNRYLKVGYRKRDSGQKLSPKFHRSVMGRKGIGKLALFAIANVIEVTSIKDGTNNPIGFVMTAEGIKKSIEGDQKYYPNPIEIKDIHITRGTRIVLKELKKGIANLSLHTRKRLARRFSVIGSEFNFRVAIDNEEIGVQDRDYFKKIQYLWTIGDDGKKYEDLCESDIKSMNIPGLIDGSLEFAISGWVGTVKEYKDLEEGNNTISILARGKLVHEDILKDIKEGGLFTKYIIGELHADFLDLNDADDIATSDRQSLVESDGRFIALKRYVQESILKTIQKKRKEWTSEGAETEARKNPVIDEWFKTLTLDRRKHARTLFDKIQSLPIENADDRRELYRYGILAFEKLALKDNLSALESLNADSDFEFLKAIFAEVDELEAIQYYYIVKGRLEILKTFEGILPNAKERVIQEHIFNHLWLLDPSWERATTNERMEQAVTTEFATVTAGLSPEERAARIDIRYQTAANKHVVIELKKYDVKVDVDDLSKQIRKYRSALKKCLREKFPNDCQAIEIICVLGTPPKPIDDPDAVENSLKSVDARFVTYDSLIDEAQQRYHEYLAKSKEVGKLVALVDQI